jgi:hypothetical protein
MEWRKHYNLDKEVPKREMWHHAGVGDVGGGHSI